jgi:NhaA family Na+:H+ antiporter
LGGLSFERDLHFWINDGLMVVFFFVVGLEIRRELHGGELSDIRRAALPVFAALGGMVVPAGIFTLLNLGTPAARGWGVPMATDIAFAVGVLALLGKRVPPALRVLLLALAVIDDLGAILVIALFYSSGLSPIGLFVAVAGIALIVLMKRLGVRSPWAYVPGAVVTWAGVYATGVHPTIAGVVIGLLTPVRPWLGSETVSPVERLQHALHRWVAFGIMPVFAVANAGVTLGGVHLDEAGRGVLAGVSLGLVLGKPIGVMLFAWVAVRLRLAALPVGISLSGVLVVGLVAGIGFTMALFIAGLAFSEGPLVEVAKLGILVASTVAAIVGAFAGRAILGRVPQSPDSVPAIK